MGVVKAILTLLLATLPLTVKNAPRHVYSDGRCLANAIHYEARGEPIKGQRAVLDTIHNRMYTSGQNECVVIYQRRQFSWTSKHPIPVYNAEQMARLRQVESYPRVLSNERYKFFYSGPKPSWANGMICRRISGQNFCKGKK